MQTLEGELDQLAGGQGASEKKSGARKNGKANKRRGEGQTLRDDDGQVGRRSRRQRPGSNYWLSKWKSGAAVERSMINHHFFRLAFMTTKPINPAPAIMPVMLRFGLGIADSARRPSLP